MKTIQILDQPRLSLGRTVRITVDGIRYRLFRSSVTLAVIAVAVAFLMNIVSESVVKSSAGVSVRRQLGERRLVLRWVARLTGAPGTEALISELAGVKPGSGDYDEIRRIGGLSEDEMRHVCAEARRARNYFNFFESIGYDRSRMLVHTAAGTEICERLRIPGKFEEFKERLKSMKSVRFVTPLDEFETDLASWPEFVAALDRVRGGYRAAVAKLDAARGEQSVLRAIAEGKPEWVHAIRAAGFDCHEATVALLGRQARQLLDVNNVERTIQDRLICQVVSQNLDILPADVTVKELWALLGTRRGAEAYLARTQERGVNLGSLDAAALVRLAREQKKDDALAEAERNTAHAGGGWLGIGERMSWLLVVSMLVCAIGISNAMLMTVTERFREIATMKCLGAMDGFIMLVFVLEACFLGLAGGIIGAILGNMIGIVRMMALLGAGIVAEASFLSLVWWTFGAIATGILLAAVAAVYPSLKGARLAPMEAMRIE